MILTLKIWPNQTGKPLQELATHWCVEWMFAETSKQTENLGRSWQHTGLDSLSESSQKLYGPQHQMSGHCPIFSRLYWYRGVKVRFVHANLPIGRFANVRTANHRRGEWHNSSFEYNLKRCPSVRFSSARIFMIFTYTIKPFCLLRWWLWG